MTAVILAAGVASRLRPLTDDTPKCLLKIGTQTILGRTIDNLLDNSIDRIILVTGYLEDKIRSFVQNNYPQLQVTFIYNADFATTNNIYSLWLAMQELSDDAMLLLDSDILFDRLIIRLLLGSSYQNCLALKSTHALGVEEIKVCVDGKGFITDISKEIEPELAIGESIGIEKFSGVGLQMLGDELERMIIGRKMVDVWYESAFQNCINNGLRLWPVDVGDLKCMELDTIEDLQLAKAEIIPYLDGKKHDPSTA